MMKDAYITVGELANHLNCKVIGDRNKKIYGISLYQESTEDLLTYVPYNKIDSIESIKAGALLTKYSVGLPVYRNYIITRHDPYEVLSETLKYLIEKGICCSENNKSFMISESAVLSENVSIGKGASIGKDTVISAGAVIGKNVSIGKNCFIGENTVVGDYTIIDDDVRIGACCCIGTENFEYIKTKTGWSKIPVVGAVHICDHVMIGGNVVVEKGTIGTTTIGSYTQVGNLVQIGHETKIGAHCHIVACVALAGWTEIGRNVDIYGQAAIGNRAKIGDNAILLARAGVDKNVKGNVMVSGFPAQDHKKEMRFQAFLRELFRMRSRKGCEGE
ncbi:MAG: UDP-3-O-(3-hydroxymyristoyl)glucosamine N-acyltransferase [Lachnospiraceae bacterium]|nr:UDP-3-O-(3-hydroxymyristoyl)glucosamine N-acyltransferase [Lachnospiraceae bacterium]